MSYGDTCHIEAWYSLANMYLSDVEQWGNNETEKFGFNNPHPWHVKWRINSSVGLNSDMENLVNQTVRSPGPLLLTSTDLKTSMDK